MERNLDSSLKNILKVSETDKKLTTMEQNFVKYPPWKT